MSEQRSSKLYIAGQEPAATPAAPPSGDANEFAAISVAEKLNTIVRTLRTAQLQSGEARLAGIFLAIGSLADLVRDECATVVQIARHSNAMADVVDSHSDTLGNILARLDRVERHTGTPRHVGR